MNAAIGASVAMAVLVIALARATHRATPSIGVASGARRGPTHGVPAERGTGPAPSERTVRGGWILVILAVVLAIFVFGLVWAVVGCAVAAGARAAVIRRQQRRRTEAVDRAVPDLVDLLVLAAGVGHPVRSCIEAVADRAPGELRPALLRVRQQCRRGIPLRAALEDLRPHLGTQGPALVEALIASHQTGAPLAEPLAHLAASGRDLRRRSAEARARRLPVTLLFPLVCCILPAFALLAVVPLLAGSLSGLRP